MREQNSATAMNRRDLLQLSAVAALIGTSTIPDKIQATQSVAMPPVGVAVTDFSSYQIGIS